MVGKRVGCNTQRQTKDHNRVNAIRSWANMPQHISFHLSSFDSCISVRYDIYQHFANVYVTFVDVITIQVAQAQGLAQIASSEIFRECGLMQIYADLLSKILVAFLIYSAWTLGKHLATLHKIPGIY